MARTLPTKAPKRRPPPRELLLAFAPRTAVGRQQAAAKGRTLLQQSAANIKSVAAAAQKISREQNVSFEEAGGILRQTLRDLKRARAAFRGMASGLTKRGATQPITVGAAVRSLTRPNVLRGVEGRTELARFVSEEEARKPTTNIRVFRTKAERSRRLLGIRR